MYNNNCDVFMTRALELGRKGAGLVSPNPMVGAVIVYNNKIIGEGWHRKFGESHAEVYAINSVLPKYRHLLKKSTIYVSLEPCSTHINTPPCSRLLIQHNIKKVIASVTDFTPGVSGAGFQNLREANIEVKTGVLLSEGSKLAAIRNTFVQKMRPYIVLKYAESSDGLIAGMDRQVWLTNQVSRRLVHRWRNELDSIFVGTKTILIDDPILDNRYWFGKNPVRLVIDRKNVIPEDANIKDGKVETYILVDKNMGHRPNKVNLTYLSMDFRKGRFFELLYKFMFGKGLSSMLVEGGSKTLQSFIDADYWDEVRRFKSNIYIGEGVSAPNIYYNGTVERYVIGNDILERFYHKSNIVVK